MKFTFLVHKVWLSPSRPSPTDQMSAQNKLRVLSKHDAELLSAYFLHRDKPWKQFQF